MKVYRDIVQGTPEWRKVRLGVITASCAERVVTPATLKPSKAQEGLVAELVAERLIGMPTNADAGKWAERGTVLEAEARDWFNFAHEEVEQVGFVARDDGRVGCSPDGWAEGRFGLELKCPAARTHVAYLLDNAALLAEYRMQVQFGLWVARLLEWRLVSYCPGLPKVVLTVAPDPKVFAALDAEVPVVLAKMDAALEEIKRLGGVDEEERAAAEVFGSYA